MRLIDDELETLTQRVDAMGSLAGDRVRVAIDLERIGDHATNIAEDAIFLTEARETRHERPA